MSPFRTFLAFATSITLVTCQPLLLPAQPVRAVIIDQPTAMTTITIPLEPIIPTTTTTTTQADDTTQLSAGEKATLSGPGFRIGDVDEPIQIIPPAIGNWHETATANTTSDDTTSRTGPWGALTGMNITINSTTEALNITVTPASPTWVDVQDQRERGYTATWPSGAPRPSDFPSPPFTTASNHSIPFNVTIRGNITEFNLTITNMTHAGNVTRPDGGWFGTWMPTGTADGMGGESTIHANLTGPSVNITVISPNSTTVISTQPNGTVVVGGDGATGGTGRDNQTVIVVAAAYLSAHLPTPFTITALILAFTMATSL